MPARPEETGTHGNATSLLKKFVEVVRYFVMWVKKLQNLPPRAKRSKQNQEEGF